VFPGYIKHCFISRIYKVFEEGSPIGGSLIIYMVGVRIYVFRRVEGAYTDRGEVHCLEFVL